jgi:acetyl esterase/lipase
MTLARRGLLASVMGLLGGCSPAALLNATVPRKGYTLEPDIAYGPGPRHKLDLYRPDTPRPDGKAVIFFYGGSWDSGSKGDYLFVAQALTASGYTVVIPDYRLYPEVRFPAFVEDGARAVRWTADRVGTERVFIMGHSAGAHIAAQAGALVTTPGYADAVGITPTVTSAQLRGLILACGPYDLQLSRHATSPASRRLPSEVSRRTSSSSRRALCG